jgi:hypothetical protein
LFPDAFIHERPAAKPAANIFAGGAMASQEVRALLRGRRTNRSTNRTCYQSCIDNPVSPGHDTIVSIVEGLHHLRASRHGNPGSSETSPRLRCRRLDREFHPEIRPRHALLSCLRRLHHGSSGRDRGALIMITPANRPGSSGYRIQRFALGRHPVLDAVHGL